MEKAQDIIAGATRSNYEMKAFHDDTGYSENQQASFERSEAAIAAAVQQPASTPCAPCALQFTTKFGLCYTGTRGKTPEHNQAKHTKHPHSLEWHNSTITTKYLQLRIVATETAAKGANPKEDNQLKDCTMIR